MKDPALPTADMADTSTQDTVELTAAARHLGLKPVRAWVPDDATVKPRTAGAARTKRAREKARALGLKQLSVTIPATLHPIIKTLAARTTDGEPVDKVLKELLLQLIDNTNTPINASSSSHNANWAKCDFGNLTPWRRWLVKKLLALLINGSVE